MDKALVGNGRVRLTTAEHNYYLLSDSTATIEEGEAFVALDGCNSGCFEHRTFHCALQDVANLQSFLRTTDLRRTEHAQSYRARAASAGSSNGECVVCGVVFTGDRGDDGSVYYLKQDGQSLDFRTVALHERCAATLADALDAVWEFPAPLLGEAL